MTTIPKRRRNTKKLIVFLDLRMKNKTAPKYGKLWCCLHEWYEIVIISFEW
jgi:hypothetical protein